MDRRRTFRGQLLQMQHMQQAIPKMSRAGLTACDEKPLGDDNPSHGRDCCRSSEIITDPLLGHTLVALERVGSSEPDNPWPCRGIILRWLEIPLE
jgi:hypothetical protein